MHYLFLPDIENLKVQREFGQNGLLSPSKVPYKYEKGPISR